MVRSSSVRNYDKCDRSVGETCAEVCGRSMKDACQLKGANMLSGHDRQDRQRLPTAVAVFAHETQKRKLPRMVQVRPVLVDPSSTSHTRRSRSLKTGQLIIIIIIIISKSEYFAKESQRRRLNDAEPTCQQQRRLLLKQMALEMTLEGTQSCIWCSGISLQTVPRSWSIDGEAALTGSSPGAESQMP